MKENVFSVTNAQKVLDFLSRSPGKDSLGKEIQKATGISKSGLHFAVKHLIKYKLIRGELRGKSFFYSVDPSNPVIRQLKILNNTILLQSLVNKIKSSSKEIILFGSSSRGEDSEDSDIDLFVLSHGPETIKKNCILTNTKRKLQLVVRTPTDYAEMETKEPTFYKEIQQGIILWQSKDESRI